MEFVVVDDSGNAADTRGVTFGSNTSYLGDVADLYRIGTYEVTNAQYAAFLNAVAATDTHNLYNTHMADDAYGSYPNIDRGGITRSGSSGSYTYSTISGRENLPANWVSFESAARFANWMHNGMQNVASTTESGAYDLSGSLPTTHASHSRYWIPTLDEWYKASYYKGDSTSAGYWNYPTQSDSAPAPGPANTSANRANYQADNYDFGEGLDHGDMTPVGHYTLSPGKYGTFDMAGNVAEWIEEVSPANSNYRTSYGGGWRSNTSDELKYDGRSHAPATSGSYLQGFRMASSPYASAKKLIQFGWDNPDTGYMLANMDHMQSYPFNGTVFTAKPSGGTTHQFSNQAFGSTLFTRAQMQHAVDELQGADYGHFTDNFLRVNVTPGNVDWVLGSFSNLYANMATAGWIVHEGGAKGIMLDLESYETLLWDYQSQIHKSTHSFEAYQQAAWEAGRDVMTNIQNEAPDITILLTFAYSYVWSAPNQLNQDDPTRSLSTIEYGLLPSFLDGMIDAAGEGVRFIDGYEPAYRAKDLEEFQAFRMDMIRNTLAIVDDPEKYLEKFGYGFGLWLDVDRTIGGWHTDPEDFDLNWYTPEEYEQTLKNALLVSDEYVWAYLESNTWWNANGGDALPQDYLNAVANAYADTPAINPEPGTLGLLATLLMLPRPRRAA